MSIKLGSSLLAGNLDKNMYPSKDEMNELFSSSVKLDGDQEINGVKTFNNNLYAPNQLDYSRITNCITYIQQDIKLELVNSTLTLKAGSKVYVPNGVESDGVTTKFDAVTIPNDIVISSTAGSYTDKWFIFYKKSTNTWQWELISHCFSGSSLPTSVSENRIGYNTSTNKMQFSSRGGSYTDVDLSFPLCIMSTVSGTITSIDQIFNGFGYIGSTVFALPGVKGLIPNGRNADGSLKNIEFTNNKVLTWEKIDNKINDWFFESTNVSIPMRGWGSTGVYHSVNSPITSTYSWSYVVPENQWYYCNASGVLSKAYPLFFGKDTSTTTTISGFETKQTFCALDYNDFKNSDLLVPVGTILPYGGSTTPTGYLLCNGATVSRTTYAKLFSAIGTTYGVGDGSTTFVIPNLNDARILKGSTIPVVGNGMTLGLTNGVDNFGITAQRREATIQLHGSLSRYGTNIGTSYTGSSGDTSNLSAGVTTDSTKSGLIANVSNSVSIRYIIKY